MRLKKNKIVLSYILGFVTLFLIVLLLLVLIIKFTICNKNYLYHLVKTNNYYQTIYDEINEEMENYLMSTGFTNEILNNLYTLDEVKNDINLFIENTYDGKVTKLQKNSIKEKLDKNIEEFLKKSNLSILNKNDLTLFENEMVEIYYNEVTLYKMANDFIPKYHKLNKIVNLVLLILGVITIILLVIMKKVKMYSFGVIFLGTGMIFLFIQMAIYDRFDMENILIITENFSQLLRIILKYISKLMSFTGIILCLFGMFKIFTFSLRRKSRKVLKIDD